MPSKTTTRTAVNIASSSVNLYVGEDGLVRASVNLAVQNDSGVTETEGVDDTLDGWVKNDILSPDDAKTLFTIMGQLQNGAAVSGGYTDPAPQDDEAPPVFAFSADKKI